MRDFHLAEYTALRSEILDALKEVPANEKLALILSGALWGWLLSHVTESAYFGVSIWIPAVITFLLALRAISLDRKFDTFHQYVQELEQEFAAPGLGWEGFIGNEKRSWFFLSQRTYWISLMAGNLAAPVIILFNDVATC